MSTRQLFDQNVFWIAAGGVKLRLTQMDATHRANTLALLRRRAEYNHMMYHIEEETEFLNAPDDVYDEWLRQSALSLRDDPVEWLERRPLVIELARLVKLDQDEAITVDGEVVPQKLEIGNALHALIEARVCMKAHEYPHGCDESCYRIGSDSE